MVKKGWKTVLIAVVCVAAGYLLGGGGIRSRAYGQSEGVASGGHINKFLIASGCSTPSSKARSTARVSLGIE